MIKAIKKWLEQRKCKHKRLGVGTHVVREYKCLDCGKDIWKKDIDVSMR